MTELLNISDHDISLSLITKKKKSIFKDRSIFVQHHLYNIKDGEIIFET